MKSHEQLNEREQLILVKDALREMESAVPSNDPGWTANQRANIVALRAEIRRLEKEL